MFSLKKSVVAVLMLVSAMSASAAFAAPAESFPLSQLSVFARQEVPATCKLEGLDRVGNKAKIDFFDPETFRHYTVTVDSATGRALEREMSSTNITGSTVVFLEPKEIVDRLYSRYGAVSSLYLSLVEDGKDTERVVYRATFSTPVYSLGAALISPVTGNVVKEKLIYR